MIEITHLTKKYGSHVAVDDLNLTVEPGKIYGFLGPNGAGKSTTMNMITGYMGATGGTVKINGFDIFAQPEEAKKCVGYLPELPPLYVEMTVQEYLNFVAELKKLPKEERQKQVEDIMERTGINEMKNRLIRNLSKGYKQRVGLAQAILGNPEVIILDEPTVGLDPKQIIEMRDLIRELGKEHTVILSSHILSEISEVCDHIFIISKGKLVASDSTENLGNLMQQSQKLRMEVKGEKEQIEAAMQAIEQINAFEITAGEEPGVCQVLVDVGKKKNAPWNEQIDEMSVEQEIVASEVCAEDMQEKEQTERDIRETLFYAFAEAKLPIYGMRKDGESLEDVFLKLTQEAGGEA